MLYHSGRQHSEFVLHEYDSILVLASEIDCKDSQYVCMCAKQVRMCVMHCEMCVACIIMWMCERGKRIAYERQLMQQRSHINYSMDQSLY